MRLIDADALQERLKKKKPDPAAPRYAKEFNDALLRFKSMVHSAPTIELERKNGVWIPQNYNKTNGMASTAVYYYPKCSVCGQYANYTNFCPNCGADMRGN